MIKRLLSLSALVLLLPLLVACSDKDDDWEESTPEYAPLRAHAGLSLHQHWMEGPVVSVQRLEAEGPAARAGLADGDIIRRAGGLDVESTHDVYASIEARRPGESLPLEIDRYVSPSPGSPLQFERRHFVLHLVEEPPPIRDPYAGDGFLRAPYTGLHMDDQARLGMLAR
jgi:hypothetical protein